jgi:hypothetical protein
MDWVLVISIIWVVGGVSTAPSTIDVVLFPSEQRCEEAAEAVRKEIAAPLDDENIKTYGKVVCFHRKDG